MWGEVHLRSKKDWVALSSRHFWDARMEQPPHYRLEWQKSRLSSFKVQAAHRDGGGGGGAAGEWTVCLSLGNSRWCQWRGLLTPKEQSPVLMSQTMKSIHCPQKLRSLQWQRSPRPSWPFLPSQLLVGPQLFQFWGELMSLVPRKISGHHIPKSIFHANALSPWELTPLKRTCQSCNKVIRK